MITYQLGPREWDAAMVRARELPVYGNSFRREAANYVGALGELLVKRWLDEAGIAYIDRREATTHDFELLDGTTFDVKTKDRTVPPQPDHDCTLPVYNHNHQRPKGFVFVSLQRRKGTVGPERFHHGHVLGAQSLEFVDEKGVLWPKGRTDQSNGTTFWTDCINIKVEELVAPADITPTWVRRSPAFT